MASTDLFTKEGQAHTLEWAYGSFAHAGYTQEHNRKGNSRRAVASSVTCAPGYSDCCQDGFNVAPFNVKGSR